MPNSPYFRDMILSRTMLLDSLFISLHTADPGTDGDNEISDYQRQSVDFRRLGVGTIANANELVYREMPAATITHFGIWDAQVDGNFYLGGQVADVRQILAGQRADWQPGDLVVRF